MDEKTRELWRGMGRVMGTRLTLDVGPSVEHSAENGGLPVQARDEGAGAKRKPSDDSGEGKKKRSRGGKKNRGGSGSLEAAALPATEEGPKDVAAILAAKHGKKPRAAAGVDSAAIAAQEVAARGGKN